jgi:hypothetical protein
MQLLAGTSLAEIACKWLHLQETQKREEFADTVLDRSSGQTPLVGRLQFEAGPSRARSTLLHGISNDKGETLERSGDRPTLML